MRRLCLLAFVLLVGCSKAPSTSDVYDAAWKAFRQGKLQAAHTLVNGVLQQDAAKAPLNFRLLEAEILLSQGEARKGQALLDQIANAPDPALQLRLLVDRAEAVWKLKHDAPQATKLLDEVDRLGGDSAADPVFKSQLLRSAILSSSEQFEAAEELLRKTAARAAKAGDAFNEAASFLNLSFSKIRQVRFDESVEFSLAAIQAAQRAGASRIIALANNNLGIAYTVLGDLAKAETHEAESARTLREIGDLLNLEDALGELGNLRLRTGQPDQATALFKESVDISNKIDAGADAARWSGQMALALIRQKKWDEAAKWDRNAYELFQKIGQPNERLFLELNEAAISQGRGQKDDAILRYRELIDKAGDNAYLRWNAHVQLGSLFASEKRYPEANEEYEQGLAVIEQFGSSLLSKDSRMRYQDLKMEFFRDYVDLLIFEGQEEKALQVAEYSRARVLSEGLGLRAKGLQEAPTKGYQQYARRSGSVLLSYWLGPRRSFVWVIRPDGIRVKELPGEAEITRLLTEYRKSIEESLRDPVKDGSAQASRLHDLLLKPVEEELQDARRVLIVPDGSLHSLNFETLPGSKPDRYWIEDVEVSVAPSLQVLTGVAHKRVAKPSLLLLGAPLPPNPDYKPLTASGDEVRAIEARFDSRQRLVRTAAAATPRAFLEASPERYSMIHFTAHAEANREDPLESAIILSQDRTGYKLYARDIAGIKLSADLVSISACSSAGARSYGGEGLVGFAWAFLQSGAGSVIAGLWDVGDSSSAKLMSKLYEGLTVGHTPAAALREAKLELLRSTGAERKPFYWGPYQIYIRE